MADEGYDRTFPNDPNPPAKPPEAPAVSTTPATGEGGGASPQAAPEGQPGAPAADPAAPKALFRVVRNDNGGRDIYKLTDDLETSHWGTAANGDDVDKVLNAAAQYDPNTQSWDVPESVARSIADGRLAFPQQIAQAISGGESGVVRAYNGLALVNGTAKREDVLARNQEDLLKAQLAPDGQPSFAWHGLGQQVADALTHPVDALLSASKFALSSAAGFLPMGVEVAKGAAKGAATVGGGPLLAAAATGTLELPPVLAGVTWLSSAGALAGASKTLIQLETGGIAADMLDQGYDDKTIKEYATVGGAIKGALWMTGFKFLPAPGKEMVLGAMAKSDAFQSLAANWLVKYGAEVGGVTTLGVAQEKIRQVLNNMAATAANKPELLIGDEKGHDLLLHTALTMAAGSAVLGLPGAVGDAAKAREVNAADAKLAEKTKARLAERAKEEPARVVPELSSVELKTAPVEGTPTEVPSSKAETPGAGPTSPEKALDEALKTGKPEEVLKATDNIIEQLNQEPAPAEDKAAPQTYEQKYRETEARAAQRQLEADLADVQQHIAEQTAARDRFERLGHPTKALDSKLNDLMDKEQELKNGITFYEAAKGQALVTPNEKLSMKPATLESIANLGFVEGRKEVLNVRRQKILAVADKLELSRGDVGKLLREKNYGTMSDAEFENWLNKGGTKDGEHTPSFVERAAELKKSKIAREELRGVQKDRAIKHEQYVRQLHDFPTINKMTPKQMHDYADILRTYDKGDEALSAERVKALNVDSGTGDARAMAGVRTLGEARKKAPALTGQPVTDFNDTEIPRITEAIPDPQLRRWYPALRPFVDFARRATDRALGTAERVKTPLMELAAKAVAERKAISTLGERAGQFLATQQRELMRYIEDPSEKNAAALTPSETKLAEFWRAWASGAEDYYIKRGEIEKATQYSGKYIPHTARGFLEIVKEIKDVGIGKSFLDMLPHAKDTQFASQGGRLGFTMKLSNLLRRTGELEPSKNVIRVMADHIDNFYNKVAQDEISPVLDTLARALRPPDGDPQGAAHTMSTLEKVVKDYANNKKGINDTGGLTEALVTPVLRASRALASIHFIQGNFALQAMVATAKVLPGEFMALGTDMGLAKIRKYTDQGRAILEKYSEHIPQGPLDALREPGSGSLGDFTHFVLNGAFALSKKTVMEDIILGSMTKEEFKAGEFSSPERLSAAKLEAGRWINLEGMSSVIGSSEMGKTETQMKKWAVPALLSIGEDMTALGAKLLAGKPMTPDQVRDWTRLSVMAVMTITARQMLHKDMEDDTFRGRTIHYLRRAIVGLWAGLEPTFFFGPMGPLYVQMLAKDVSMLTKVEEDDTTGQITGIGSKFKTDGLDHAAGENKGWAALKKDLTPAMVKQFQKKEEK